MTRRDSARTPGRRSKSDPTGRGRRETDLDLDELAGEAGMAMLAGNVMAPFRACAEAAGRVDRDGRRLLYAVLRDLVTNHSDRFTLHEKRAAVGCIAGLRDPALAKELDSVRRLLSRVRPARRKPEAGRVNVLLESGSRLSGRAYGTVAELLVVRRAYGEMWLLDHPADEGAMNAGFRAGVDAALQFLFRNGLGGLDSASWLTASSFVGSFPRLGAREGGPEAAARGRIRVEGASLGMGSAVAVLSTLLQAGAGNPGRPMGRRRGAGRLAVPEGVAFTGRIDRNGRISAVGNVPEKLEAALERGIRRIFVPRENRGDIPRALRADAGIIAVSGLDQIVERLYPQKLLSSSIAALSRSALPIALRQRHWRYRRSHPEDVQRVLLTSVSGADCENKSGVASQDGPILTLCRELRIRKAYLFHTVGAAAGKRNAFEGAARAVREALSKLTPSCRAELVPLGSVTNPTNLSELFPAFRLQVEKIISKLDPAKHVTYVNTTSGSKQMDTTWHVLVERGFLPDYRFQVLPEDLVEEGESRIKRIVMPIL